MSPPSDKPDRAIPHDRTFHRREWLVQRIGWGFMALILAGAVVGLLAPGPLSQTTTGKPGDPLRVSYSRVEHARHEAALRFHVAPASRPEQRLTLALSRDFLQNLKVVAISPDPQQVQSHQDNLLYTFVADSGALTIVFFVETDAFGRWRGHAVLDSHPPVRLTQYILP